MRPCFKLGLYMVYNGIENQIKFQTDHWIGSQSLSTACPSLFQIASNRSATISSHIHNNTWTLSFRILLSPMRVQTLFSLILLLPSPFTTYPSSDQPTWALTTNGQFSVAFIYHHINQIFSKNNTGIYNLVSTHSPKVKFTIWLIL